MSSFALNKSLEAALDSRRRRNILRRLPSPTRSSSRSSQSSSSSPHSNNSDGNTNETELVDLVSNDYLSLSLSQSLRQRYLTALAASPSILGSTGSRLLVNPQSHVALETRLKTFFDAEATLLFNSGFDANVSLFSCLPQDGDVVVYDAAIHASVHDGLRASRLGKTTGALLPFEHNSVDTLRSILVNLLKSSIQGAKLHAGTQTVFIAVEALYSMDGTLAPLPSIVALIDELFPKHNALLIVDEAHAVGVYGPQGRGLCAHYGKAVEEKVFIKVITFGKALASSGGESFHFLAMIQCTERTA